MNRRRFLRTVLGAGAAVALAPVAALAAKPAIYAGLDVGSGKDSTVAWRTAEEVRRVNEFAAFNRDQICAIFQVPPHMVPLPGGAPILPQLTYFVVVPHAPFQSIVQLT